MECLAEGAAERAHTRFEKIAFYVNLGFTDLVFHFPGEDQEHALA